MSETIDSIEIAPGIHWVGKRDPSSLFHANPYLRVFTGDDGRSLSTNVSRAASQIAFEYRANSR